MNTFTISKKKIFQVQEHLNKIADDYGKKFNCQWQKRKPNETLDAFVSKMSNDDKHCHLLYWARILAFSDFLDTLVQIPPFGYSPMIYQYEYQDQIYDIMDDAIIKYCNLYNESYNLVYDIKKHPETRASEFGGDLKGYTFFLTTQMYFTRIIMKDVGLKATFDEEKRITNIEYDD